MSQRTQLLAIYNGRLVELVCDENGKLLIEGSISIDASDINIGNVDVVSLPSSPRAKASATVSRVSGSASNTTLLAANASRTRVIIYNESTADLYVKFGATASATSYTTKLGPGDTYESPTDWVYTGIIDGIWSAANGAAQITEL